MTKRSTRTRQTASQLLLRHLAGYEHTLYREGRRVFLDESAPAELHALLQREHDQVAAQVLPHVDPAQREAVTGLLRGLATVLVADPSSAAVAVAGILASRPTVLAVDTETAVLPEHRGPIPVRLTRDGRVAKIQPKDGAAGAALDPRRARVRLVQVYAGGDTVYLFDMHGVPWSALAPLFELELAMHNAVFDVRMILASGGPEPTGRIYDTATAMRLVNGTRASLADAARALLGIALPKTLGASDWSLELDADQLAYAALDPVVTYWLWQAQQAQFDDADRNAQQIVDEATVAVARMELAGMPFDAAAHLEMVAGWREHRDAALAALNAAWGTRYDRLPTNAQVVAYLERVLDAADLYEWPTTPGGALSVAAAALKAAAGVVPGIAELLTLRRWEKALSTYGDELAARVADGRLYAGFLIAGARTGRMSSRAPNMQNMPKRSRELADFRRIFRAAEGRVLVAADYSQIELREAAEQAGDETMLAAFAAGEDVHAAMARSLEPDYDQLPDDERKAARSLAKAANFGLLYGSGVRGFAMYARTAFGIELTHDNAAAVIETWRNTYPGIAAWQIEQARTTRDAGYVQTVGGRRWYWEWRAHDEDELDDLEDYQLADARSGFERNYSLNHPIQGTCAELLYLAIAYCDRDLRYLDARLVAAVHDELVVECAAEAAAAVQQVLQQAMTRAWLDFHPDTPTGGLVDVHAAQTWAEAH